MTGGAVSHTVGLRIDVDTLRGTRSGVPALLDILGKRDIRASIFFSVGPDNMGRHLWRLVRPTFALKMLRSKAASLYGWDILARGVLWPGPMIAEKCADVIRASAKAGHEVGLHAWDHHKWQMQINRMNEAELEAEIGKGLAALQGVLGTEVTCSAAPGWRCNVATLSCTEPYRMRYHSDCRGTHVFRPTIAGNPATPQIPVTLPTYDEVIGRNGIKDENFNAFLLDRIAATEFPVLTIHAEVEGIAKQAMFERFLDDADARGMRFCALGDLLPPVERIGAGSIGEGHVAGREGTVCMQVH
jgi:undecaprenyl phosphate-alpha-L-ara4FN deformylase